MRSKYENDRVTLFEIVPIHHYQSSLELPAYKFSNTFYQKHMTIFIV